MNAETRIALLEAEGASFLLMSGILREMPDHEWLNALATDGVFNEIPYAQDNEFVLKGAEALQAWAASYDEAAYELVYKDCMRLLIGPGRPLAAPWESVYSDKNEGLLFQQETLDVRRAYRAVGLQVEQLYREPDDHISYEFEFVATLCNRAAAALNENCEEEAQHLLLAKDSFVRDHLAAWVFQWCDLMEEHASTNFYRGISLLTRGFLQAALNAAAE